MSLEKPQYCVRSTATNHQLNFWKAFMQSRWSIAVFFCLIFSSVSFAGNQTSVVTLNGKMYVIGSAVVDNGGDNDGGDAPVNYPPQRFNGQPKGILVAGTTETILSINTDVIAECRYKVHALGLTFDTMTPFTTTSGMLHSVFITGLTDGGKFEYSVRCKDIATGATNQKNYNIPFSIDVAARIGDL
jgi:hypothetical protein